MYSELINMINKCNVISFDIFDTLLFRNIARPTDIFKILEYELKEKYSYDNFSNLRIKSESQTRSKSVNNEVSYDDIYEEISSYISNTEILNYAKKRELELELEFIANNPFMHKIYDYCLENNKTIFFISDMYLEESFIKKMLKKCGYSEGLKNLYVSYKYNKNKGTGELFKFVKDKENLKYSSWLHIGDNSISDYDIPIKLGMNAYNYKNVNSYENINCNSIFESIILGMRNNYIYNGINLDYWQMFGVKYLTPLYIGFTNWIYIMTYKCDNLYFLSRDGYIIEKIFKLFPKRKQYTKYLYCSRNSTQIPSMIDYSKDYMINFLTPIVDDQTTVKDLFLSCQLKVKDEYLKILNLYGFKSFNDIVNYENRYNAIKCISSVFEDTYSELNKKKDLVIKYLNQEKMNDFSMINIVDIGWSGSIQESIQRLLHKTVRGYYFGTINTGKYDYITNSFGYMFDQDNPIYYKDKVFSQVMMYEFIFSAPHGSVIGYKQQKNKIKPIFKEDDNTLDAISSFQSESLKLIKEILKYYKYYDSLSRDFCFQFYNEFLNKFDYNDMLMFSKIENDYLLGNDKKFPYVITLEKKYLLDNYNTYKELTNRSLWKGAFLIKGCNSEKQYKDFIKYVENKNLDIPIVSKKNIRMLFRKSVPLKVRRKLKGCLRINR